MSSEFVVYAVWNWYSGYSGDVFPAAIFTTEELAQRWMQHQGPGEKWVCEQFTVNDPVQVFEPDSCS